MEVSRVQVHFIYSVPMFLFALPIYSFTIILWSKARAPVERRITSPPAHESARVSVRSTRYSCTVVMLPAFEGKKKGEK